MAHDCFSAPLLDAHGDKQLMQLAETEKSPLDAFATSVIVHTSACNSTL